MDEAELVPFRRVWAAQADIAGEREEARTGRPAFPDRPMSRYDMRRLRERNDAPDEGDWDGDGGGE